MADEPELRAVLVEDNLMFSAMVEPQLRRLGYAVRTLSGGPSTVEQIAEAPPDVLLINLTSNRYVGVELVRALRSRPELAAMGVVGYAGHVEREFFQAGRDAGADLVAPNSAIRASLAAVLEKLARRRAGGDSEWAADDTD